MSRRAAINAKMRKIKLQNSKAVLMRWIDFASSMINDPQFNFASETLRGIRSTIIQSKIVTHNQIVALNNIYEGGSNKYRGLNHGEFNEESIY